ncbi:MAG: hypothetical protein H7281_01425 [Bacteriovorax sp.]|nr:hypothetical protein [Bacteriovorax sp.]
MKIAKYLFLALLIISSKVLLASEVNVSLDEFEVKEEIARTLGLNAQEFEIAPAAIEYGAEGVGLKGRLFITWSVKDILASNESITYNSNGMQITSSSNLEKNEKGNVLNSVKIGYQLFNNLGVETSYERTSSTMGISSLAGSTIGSLTTNSSSIANTKIKNDFQYFKIGLVTNANIVDSKSFRLDLVASANAGLITLNSTNKTNGDIYNGALGYSYGAEVGVRAIHKSGLYVSTGIGMNNKVLAPKTYANGSSSEFDGSEKYVFVNVGYSFGGKRRR